MLQHVESDHQVDRAVTEGQCTRVAPHHAQPAVARHLGAVRAVLDSHGAPAGVAQHPRVAATRRPDVDRDAGPEAPELAAQQVASLGVPPVRVLEFGELPDLGSLQRRDSLPEGAACSASSCRSPTEQDVLPLFLGRLRAVLDEMGGAHEVLVVDHGGRDDTPTLPAQARLDWP